MNFLCNFSISNDSAKHIYIILHLLLLYENYIQSFVSLYGQNNHKKFHSCTSQIVFRVLAFFVFETAIFFVFRILEFFPLNKNKWCSLQKTNKHKTQYYEKVIKTAVFLFYYDQCVQNKTTTKTAVK